MGKIGKDSPTIIQPVSERSDGIKSFFQKQTTSPAKPKAEPPSSKAAGESTPEQKVKDDDVKVKPEGIKAEISAKDEEKGLGDDSNAPNPASGSVVKKEEHLSPSTTAKLEKDEVASEEDDKDTSTSLTKRKRDEKGGAGHRTKVVRKESDEGTKAVSHLISELESETDCGSATGHNQLFQVTQSERTLSTTIH